MTAGGVTSAVAAAACLHAARAIFAWGNRASRKCLSGLFGFSTACLRVTWPLQHLPRTNAGFLAWPLAIHANAPSATKRCIELTAGPRASLPELVGTVRSLPRWVTGPRAAVARMDHPDHGMRAPWRVRSPQRARSGTSRSCAGSVPTGEGGRPSRGACTHRARGKQTHQQGPRRPLWRARRSPIRPGDRRGNQELLAEVRSQTVCRRL